MWGYHWFFPFGIFFFVLFFACFIFRIFAFRRYGMGCNPRYRGQFDAVAVLKRRLANGEIKEDEYQRLKDVLDK